MKSGMFIWCVLCCCFLHAQPPIGQWREHMPYNAGVSVCAQNNRIYCATDKSIFYVETEDNNLQTLSRVNGLAETGIALMKKNELHRNTQ
jgi:hypothetical protein